MLSPSQIQEFASRPKVKKTAVENFLGSLYDVSYQEAVANCEMDARSYKWNHETVGAIREGLVAAFFSKESK